MSRQPEYRNVGLSYGELLQRLTATRRHCRMLSLWLWSGNGVRITLSGSSESYGNPQAGYGYLSDDERYNLLKACQVSRNTDLYLLAVLAISTGARRGELEKLTWNTINLERGTLTFLDTKNRTSRTVPVTGLALGPRSWRRPLSAT